MQTNTVSLSNWAADHDLQVPATSAADAFSSTNTALYPSDLDLNRRCGNTTCLKFWGALDILACSTAVVKTFPLR
jgi:hypothetical protein